MNAENWCVFLQLFSSLIEDFALCPQAFLGVLLPLPLYKPWKRWLALQAVLGYFPVLLFLNFEDEGILSVFPCLQGWRNRALGLFCRHSHFSWMENQQVTTCILLCNAQHLDKAKWRYCKCSNVHFIILKQFSFIPPNKGWWT